MTLATSPAAAASGAPAAAESPVRPLALANPTNLAIMFRVAPKVKLVLIAPQH